MIKGPSPFDEWWCLQVPHKAVGEKNAHPLRVHSMTDSVERKRIKAWSHQIISSCFFFLLVKITSKGPLCLESSFTWQPLLPRKTVLWMCTHSLLAIFVKIVAAWVNQEERHCFSPAVDSELVLSDPSFLLIFFLSSSSSFFSSSSRWSSSRPAGLELSINKDYFQFLILLPSPPRYWDYRCAASRVTLYLTRLMLFRLPSLFKKKYRFLSVSFDR